MKFDRGDETMKKIATLDELPDDCSFDPEELWEKMEPKLLAQEKRRKLFPYKMAAATGIIICLTIVFYYATNKKPAQEGLRIEAKHDFNLRLPEQTKVADKNITVALGRRKNAVEVQKRNKQELATDSMALVLFSPQIADTITARRQEIIPVTTHRKKPAFSTRHINDEPGIILKEPKPKSIMSQNPKTPKSKNITPVLKTS